MRMLSLIQSLLLCCTIFLATHNSFAVTSKDEVDIESVKAPPRDVKDILRVIESTKQDEKEVEKAKKVLAIPVPSSTNPEVLNS